MSLAPVPLSRYIAIFLVISFTLLFFTRHASASQQNNYLPLEIGAVWELRDASGHFQIVVRDKVLINDKEHYRVDWVDDTLGGRYQSEFWISTSDGIYVGGRQVGGQLLMFEKPYLLLKHRPTVGEQWKANIRNPAYSDTLAFVIEKRETITTDIGELEAIKVVLTGRALRIIRWYSAGVGLVKEASFKKGKDGFVLFNEKVLTRRIPAAEKRTPRDGPPAGTDPKNAQYVSLLIGNWSVKDDAHENVFTFFPDGTFQGRLIQQNTVVWTYSGTWSVSRDKVIWEYKENSPQRIPPGSQDSDGIIIVDDKELIIQEGKSGNFSRFSRVH